MVDSNPVDPSTSPFSEPDRFQALECLARLHWEGMTRPTTLRTLIFLANLMNEYRNAWGLTPDDRIHSDPIYRVPIPPTFQRVYLAIQSQQREKKGRSLTCWCLSSKSSIVFPARHMDGQTRTRQNLIKRYDILIHLVREFSTQLFNASSHTKHRYQK